VRGRATRCGRARSWSRVAALYEATAVGGDSRAGKLTATARAFRHPRSPARAGERPSPPLARRPGRADRDRADHLGSIRTETAEERVQTLTAGIVNLVPEGLILLVSLTAAVSAFKIAQRGVLAQQLNARGVARLGRRRLQRQDGHADGADRSRGWPCCRRGGVDESPSRVSWPCMPRPRRLATRRFRRSRTPGSRTSRRSRGGAGPVFLAEALERLDLGGERLVLGRRAVRRRGSDDRGTGAHGGGIRPARAGARTYQMQRFRPPARPAVSRRGSRARPVVLAERLRPNAAETGGVLHRARRFS
jgi:hypothetical protein